MCVVWAVADVYWAFFLIRIYSWAMRGPWNAPVRPEKRVQLRHRRHFDFFLQFGLSPRGGARADLSGRRAANVECSIAEMCWCVCLFITVDVSVYFHSLFHTHLRFTDVTPRKSLPVCPHMKMQIAEHNSAADNQYTAHKCVFFVGKKHVKRDLTLMWNQYGRSFTFLHSFKCFVSFFLFSAAQWNTHPRRH